MDDHFNRKIFQICLTFSFIFTTRLYHIFLNRLNHIQCFRKCFSLIKYKLQFQLSGDRFQFFGRTAVTLIVCVSDLLDQALHVCIQLVNLILHGQDDCHKCFPAEIIQFFFCIYFCHGCRSPLSDVPIVTQR